MKTFITSFAKRICATAATAVIAVLAVTAVTAQIPQSITVQGQLWKNNGEPLNDGSYSFTVTLFDAPTGGNGTIVCNPCATTTQRGVFALVLGGAGQTPLPPMDKPYWVSIAIGAEELQPRLPLHSVPYALSSNGGSPIGSITAFAGPLSRIPNGWAACDGSALRSGEHSLLYQTIGQMWGAASDDADQTTDFNLPDLRGMFLRGADMQASVDKHAYERQPIESARASVDGVATTQGLQSGFSNEGFAVDTPPFILGSVPASTDVAKQATQFVQSLTPNASVIYIIRVR